MLFADKQQLQRQLEVDLLNLRQKELDHFTTCCLTLSSPAALIAGFAYTGIAEVSVPEDTHWAAEALYYALTVAAMLFQIAATIRSSLVALMGPALALRGKAGAMHRSVEAMEPCFRGAWQSFLAGMLCWLMSTLVLLFIQAQHWGIALFVSVGILLGTVEIFRDIMFISMRFNLPLSQVERGSFTPQEVSRMFRNRRNSRTAGDVGPGTRRRERSSTSRFLIQAAENRPRDTRLKSLTRQQTITVESRVPSSETSGPCRVLAASSPSRETKRVAPASDKCGKQGLGSPLNSAFEEKEFLKERSRRRQGAQTVRFEMDDSEQPVAVSQVAQAPAAVPREKKPGRSGLSTRGRNLFLLGDGGYLPCVREGPTSVPAVQSAADQTCEVDGEPSVSAAGAAAGAVELNADAVNVVLTVRDGKRLRWQVRADTTVRQLLEQAQENFEMEVTSLLDSNGALLSNADEAIGRHARLSGEGRVAYFEVVPKNHEYDTNSFPRMLWSNFLGQI